MLILLGSPRKNGNSSALAEQLARGARDAGATVDSVYLNGLTIKPCQGCEKCQRDDATGCAVDDDMTPLYAKLMEADVVVMASPVYWFNVSAQTKIFIDRLYAVGVGQNNIFKGKHFAFVMTYADPDPFVSGAVNALRSFQDICRHIEATVAGMVYGSACGPGEIKGNSEVMDQAYLLGRRLAANPHDPRGCKEE
jgi:multimeric flavodoxin WrbA